MVFHPQNYGFPVGFRILCNPRRSAFLIFSSSRQWLTCGGTWQVASDIGSFSTNRCLGHIQSGQKTQGAFEHGLSWDSGSIPGLGTPLRPTLNKHAGVVGLAATCNLQPLSVQHEASLQALLIFSAEPSSLHLWLHLYLKHTSLPSSYGARSLYYGLLVCPLLCVTAQEHEGCGPPKRRHEEKPHRGGWTHPFPGTTTQNVSHMLYLISALTK